MTQTVARFALSNTNSTNFCQLSEPEQLEKKMSHTKAQRAAENRILETTK